jgi:hypothetical protein
MRRCTVDRTVLDLMFRQYVDTKRATVDDKDEDDNDIPMLLYVGDGPLDEGVEGNVFCIVVPGGREDVCHALAYTMAQHFIPYWAAICSDGYVAKDSDVPDEYKHAGGLVELAALDSDIIKECLTITAFDHAGDAYSTSRTYWYDDDGDIWFNDEDGPASESSGPLIDVLKDVTSLWGKTHIEILQTIASRGPFLN